MIPSGAREKFWFLNSCSISCSDGGLELSFSPLSLYIRTEFCTNKKGGGGHGCLSGD